MVMIKSEKGIRQRTNIYKTHIQSFNKLFLYSSRCDDMKKKIHSDKSVKPNAVIITLHNEIQHISFDNHSWWWIAE